MITVARVHEIEQVLEAKADEYKGIDGIAFKEILEFVLLKEAKLFEYLDFDGLGEFVLETFDSFPDEFIAKLKEKYPQILGLEKILEEADPKDVRAEIEANPTLNDELGLVPQLCRMPEEKLFKLLIDYDLLPSFNLYDLYSNRTDNKTPETPTEPCLTPPATTAKSVAGDGVKPPNLHPESTLETAPMTSEVVNYRYRVEAALTAIDAVVRNQGQNYTEAIAQFGGWGSLSRLFTERPDMPEWEKRACGTLKGFLSPQEYASARNLTLNSFYTSPEVIRAIWAFVLSTGWEGGEVLDPGCGTRRFWQYAPEAARQIATGYTGVEKDYTTHLMGLALTPLDDQGKSLNDFSEHGDFLTWATDLQYHLVIGNFPFEDGVTAGVPDLGFGLKVALHGRFLLRALSHLRPGGLLAVITSPGLMDGSSKAYQGLRARVEAMAVFLGAVRLPEQTHASSGTECTSDLIILRKRSPADNADNEFTEASVPWQKVYTSPKLNAYWSANPTHHLGEFVPNRTRGGQGAGARWTGSYAELISALNQALKSIQENYMSRIRKTRDDSPKTGWQHVEVAYNAEQDGVEIRFSDAIPKVISGLLGWAGFKFHRDKFWWVKVSPEVQDWLQNSFEEILLNAGYEDVPENERSLTAKGFASCEEYFVIPSLQSQPASAVPDSDPKPTAPQEGAVVFEFHSLAFDSRGGLAFNSKGELQTASQAPEPTPTPQAPDLLAEEPQEAECPPTESSKAGGIEPWTFSSKGAELLQETTARRGHVEPIVEIPVHPTPGSTLRQVEPYFVRSQFFGNFTHATLEEHDRAMVAALYNAPGSAKPELLRITYELLLPTEEEFLAFAQTLTQTRDWMFHMGGSSSLHETDYPDLSAEEEQEWRKYHYSDNCIMVRAPEDIPRHMDFVVNPEGNAYAKYVYTSPIPVETPTKETYQSILHGPTEEEWRAKQTAQAQAQEPEPETPPATGFDLDDFFSGIMGLVADATPPEPWMKDAVRAQLEELAKRPRIPSFRATLTTKWIPLLNFLNLGSLLGMLTMGQKLAELKRQSPDLPDLDPLSKEMLEMLARLNIFPEQGEAIAKPAGQGGAIAKK
jgi:hypothetical protein